MIQQSTARWLWLTIALFLGVILAAWILGGTLKILLLAAAVAYLTRPLVLKMEAYKIRRTITVTFVFMLVAGVAVLLGVFLIPLLIEQIRDFVIELPLIAKSFLQSLSEIMIKWKIPIQLNLEDLASYLVTNFQDILRNFSMPVFSSLGSVLTSTLSALLWVLNLFLLPVFFFFIVLDYEKIMSFLRTLIPPTSLERVEGYAERFDRVLSGYLRGQLIVCVCLGTIYSVGLSAIGIRFGFLIGLLAGVLSIVPYVGFATGLLGAVGLALAYSVSLQVYGGIALVFAVAQLTDGLFLTPRLVGNRVGLSTLPTMLVLIAGANLGGFLGMMIAIPAGGILKILLSDLVDLYRRSRLYQSN
jgi:predicted PurR-regulated permease PerM